MRARHPLPLARRAPATASPIALQSRIQFGRRGRAVIPAQSIPGAILPGRDHPRSGGLSDEQQAQVYLVPGHDHAVLLVAVDRLPLHQSGDVLTR